MDLQELQRHWNRFGEEDPLWAILTVPGTRHGRWNRDEFFRSGVVEIQSILERVDRRVRLEGATLRRHRALDFGCGVGRLSQALADHFDECDGVDIAPSMLAAAEQANRHGARCRYHLNDRDDLSMFDDGSFDFIYTAHVLQHMEPRYSKRFIAEFLRLLAPGGYALFEVVTELVVGATGPMPDDGFAARLAIPPRLTLAAGQRHVLPVTITNASRQVWPAAGDNGWFFVTVGNHWCRPSGHVLQQDDGRALLPHDVTPNEVLNVELDICAPRAPGRYRLEVDLVQEGVGWFANRGSAPASAVVTVTSTVASGTKWPTLPWRRTTGTPRTTTAADSPRSAATEPIMEMHGITESEVAAIVTASGGRIVDMFDWDEMNERPSTDWHRRGFLVALTGPERHAAGPPE